MGTWCPYLRATQSHIGGSMSDDKGRLDVEELKDTLNKIFNMDKDVLSEIFGEGGVKVIDLASRNSRIPQSREAARQAMLSQGADESTANFAISATEHIVTAIIAGPRELAEASASLFSTATMQLATTLKEDSEFQEFAALLLDAMIKVINSDIGRVCTSAEAAGEDMRLYQKMSERINFTVTGLMEENRRLRNTIDLLTSEEGVEAGKEAKEKKE